MAKAENLYITDLYTVRKITPAGVHDPGGEGRRAGLQGRGGVRRRYRQQLYSQDQCGRRGKHGDRGLYSRRSSWPTGSATNSDEPVGLAYFGKQLSVPEGKSQTIRRIR